jgi:hypothetical protein
LCTVLLCCNAAENKMVINVGIKERQGEKISEILIKDPKKYGSKNDFVQRAVEELISKELNEKNTEQPIFDALKKIEDFMDNILEEELEDKIIINEAMVGTMTLVSKRINELESNIYFSSDRRKILLSAISLKDRLNSLGNELEEIKIEGEPTKIYSEKINKLKKGIIENIKLIQRKHRK